MCFLFTHRGYRGEIILMNNHHLHRNRLPVSVSYVVFESVSICVCVLGGGVCLKVREILPVPYTFSFGTMFSVKSVHFPKW